jgi:hypothetical protein
MALIVDLVASVGSLNKIRRRYKMPHENMADPREKEEIHRPDKFCPFARQRCFGSECTLWVTYWAGTEYQYDGCAITHFLWNN